MPESSPPPTKPASQSLIWPLSIVTLSRLSINTARRFVYPFAAVFSRALGVPLPAITSLIALNQAAGFLSPVLGPLGDRWGYRTVMLTALGLFSLGMLAVGLFPFYLVLLVGLALNGLSKVLYDPSMRAWIAERVPLGQRGRAIGLVETSWAGASLLGIPLMGFVIARFGWRVSFFVLAAIGLISLVALRILMRPDHPQTQVSPPRPHFREGWRQLRQSRPALGAVGFGFFIPLANDTLFVVYGLWLEQGFGLGIVALGTATTVIGISELIGEGFTAMLADRVGLRRALLGGSILSAISYMLLPLFSSSLPLALLGLFLVFLTFEFTIVTSFSLFIEILPQARATMMAGYDTAGGVGRVIGALAGGLIWGLGGLPAVGLVAAIASILGIICLMWGLHSWRLSN